MIALQILAGLLLLLSLIPALILYNLYARHPLFVIAVTFYFAICAALSGLTFYSLEIGFWTMGGLTLIYLLRCLRLHRLIKQEVKVSSHALIRGDIRGKNNGFHLCFYFSIMFIRLIRLTPRFIVRAWEKKSGLQLDPGELTTAILQGAAGTHVEINADKTEISFEIL